MSASDGVDSSPDGYELSAGEGRPAVCDGCRAAGRCRLGLTYAQDLGEVVRTHLRCERSHRGSPVTAHGGWIASVFDDALAAAVLREDSRVLTGSLSVDYLAPVPLERPLLIDSWITERGDRHWLVEGELRLADRDRPLARARARFVARRPAYYGRMEERLR